MKLRNSIFYTKDITAAKAFYNQLGFHLIEDFGNFISFATDDLGVNFSINLADDPTKIPGKQTVIFAVKNIRAVFENMKNLEVTINQDLYKAPFGWTFSIRDLDGNKIEYVEA